MSKKDMDRRKKFYPGTDGRSYLSANETPRDFFSSENFQKKRKESYMMFWTNFARKERYL